MIKVVKKYYLEYELAKDVFVRLPVNVLDKISLALENIVIKLPNDFFEIPSVINDEVYNQYDPCESAKEPFPFFYVPLQETLSQLDKIPGRKEDQFSLLYVKPTSEKKSEKYPLEAMFECYKPSIPNYDFHQFRSIVQNVINSDYNDDELLEYFIETFGCEAFDFLSEIVKHRNKKIDYGSSFDGKNCYIMLLILFIILIC